MEKKLFRDTIVRPGREAQDALVKYAMREVETVPKEDIKTLLAEFNKLQNASGFTLGSESSSEGSVSETREDNRAQIPEEEKIASSKAKLKKAFADSFKDVKAYTDQRLVKQQYAIILLDQLEKMYNPIQWMPMCCLIPRGATLWMLVILVRLGRLRRTYATLQVGDF